MTQVLPCRAARDAAATGDSATRKKVEKTASPSRLASRASAPRQYLATSRRYTPLSSAHERTAAAARKSMRVIDPDGGDTLVLAMYTLIAHELTGHLRGLRVNMRAAPCCTRTPTAA